ncbi:ABC transporter substrate-binding protein [Desulfoluna limicola]|uniref:ABC transporter substrate-binding protein n=1 Tax=Desulfoluna limicola TaxID=2810562 RepID=A0ABN6F4S0_9BACT|nr:ABC transporter substrate-binding protein [Desulfoluna limicola]BCS97109.1 ABC transporter substrate-binding protein [Desulfoluna limicola]
MDLSRTLYIPLFLSIIVPWLLLCKPVRADDQAINKWAAEFSPSALSMEERVDELTWFHAVSRNFRGKKIKTTAEDIQTHYWERDVLSKAFEEITGIQVTHDIVSEGEVVRKISEQLMAGRMIYDAYVNDADMIGTHLRLNRVVNLTDYMANEGKPFTNPNLDLMDFLNPEFGQDYDGNQLQLPDQQFANLYWFRYDWFTDPKTKAAFRDSYGYDLGVPLNWAAYEDIAQFFTGRPMTNPDGSTVSAFGHLDYGNPSPSLGWRYTDAWLSIAGVGDKGLPNGLPVDEWGIRVENRIPVGSMVERGGALNSPAAVYALTKYLEWMAKYAPGEARNWDWQQAGTMAARGDIAQRIFQYITWLSDEAFHKKGGPMVDQSGRPVWRVAPTPHGKYWEEGMKVGYQDAGSWTIPWNVRDDRRTMAWLWIQFCVSKTVGVKKFLAGGTPVRKSTVHAPYLTTHAYKWGGIIEFYRSPEEKKWTDSGPNVPHYPALSGLWWTNIAKAIGGKFTPQETMDTLARQQDELMGKLKLTRYSPKLNPIKPQSYWLNKPGAPKKEIKERPMGKTIDYDVLIRLWNQDK